MTRAVHWPNVLVFSLFASIMQLIIFHHNAKIIVGVNNINPFYSDVGKF